MDINVTPFFYKECNLLKNKGCNLLKIGWKGMVGDFCLERRTYLKKWGMVALQNRIFYSNFNHSLMGELIISGGREELSIIMLLQGIYGTLKFSLSGSLLNTFTACFHFWNSEHQESDQCFNKVLFFVGSGFFFFNTENNYNAT